MSTGMKRRNSLSLAISGSGGAGVMTAAGVLLAAAARAGFFGLQTRSVGPQIRGGEAAAMVRLATFPVHAHAGAFDLLLAVDWRNFSRFSGEIALAPDALVIMDEASGEPPAEIARTGARLLSLPLAAQAREIGGRVNMLAVGLLGALAGLPQEALEEAIARRFAAKGEDVIAPSIAAMQRGRAMAAQLAERFAPLASPREKTDEEPWIINGNEAAALGALTAGVKFAAAYPITPATEILEWLSPALSGAGGMLVQAEDELASINMIIGASFGGAPSLTATSGPGLSLMQEGIGLAAAAEVPVTVIDVQRGGPSTGIPTKSEQTDLEAALCGPHGEAAHLVTAPTCVADCLNTTAWTVHLAEALQAPAIMLSDQMMGQMKTIMPRPQLPRWRAERLLQEPCEGGYERYRLTKSGISPMALPGTQGCLYTADGLEHGENAIPSTRVEDHAAQLAKRAAKLALHDFGDLWADVSGSGSMAVICWGSTAGAMDEAVRQARRAGMELRAIALRLLMPPQVEKMAAALEGASRLLVVENSFSGQFLRYLRAHFDLPAKVRSLRHAGPRPISAAEIFKALADWQQEA